MAFEVACPEQVPLELTVACDGREQTLRLSPSEVLRKSTLHYVEDIPPTNNGAYWHNMETCAKFKVHQGWATDRLTVDLANDLAARSFDNDAKRNDLHRRYYERISSEISPVIAIQYLQLQGQFETMFDMKLAANVP